MVATREAAALAERLLADTIAAQQAQPGQLTIHADRGTSMTSKPVALLLADLGVTKSHSRPKVSNDNPYSEAQFKTLKHHPNFPAVRLHPGSPELLPAVLRLVQPRAPPRRDRAADPR
jgi:putative transposase